MRILVVKRLILQRLRLHGLHITYFSENIWTTPQKKSVVTREPLYFIHKEQLAVLSLRITEVYSEPCQTKFLRSAFSIEQLWWLLLLITIFNFTASDNFVSEQRPKACKVIAKLKSISTRKKNHFNCRPILLLAAEGSTWTNISFCFRKWYIVSGGP